MQQLHKKNREKLFGEPCGKISQTVNSNVDRFFIFNILQNLLSRAKSISLLLLISILW